MTQVSSVDRLRKFIRIYGRKNLAAKLKVSQSAVSLWENGKRKPSHSNATRLCRLNPKFSMEDFL
jgi:transcriptional regulator with XRE-family HTH domain